MEPRATRKFPLRVVLTVSTGRLLTERKGPYNNGIGDAYAIMNWMTGDDLFTHQLPRAGEVCQPFLLEQFPILQKANDALGLLDRWLELPERDPQISIEMWLAFVAGEMKMAYDSMIDVPKLPDGVYQHMHPIQEAVEHMGIDQDKIIVVNPDDLEEK